MKQVLFRLFISIVAMFLSACSGTAVKNNGGDPVTLSNKVITAAGQAVIRQEAGLSERQVKLNAEQAAKMRAYRSLAATLYREKLAGAKTVADQVLRDESYRVYFDIFLRQAKVAEIQVLGNSLHASLALSLSDRFYQCMSGEAAVVRRCLQQDNKMQFTRLGYNLAEAKTVNLGCGVSDCSDLFHVGGFNRQKSAVDRGLLSAGLYDSEWIANTSGRLLLNFLLINGLAQ